MQEEDFNFFTPLKEKDIEVETPSTMKSESNRMSLRKRTSNPLLNRQVSNKENSDGLPKLKKTASNVSKMTRSTRSQKAKLVDEM